jgi:hypothetical protein
MVNEARKSLFRSGHAEFVEAVVVDAEVVANFMENGDSHLFANVIVGIANGLDVVLIDADAVGKDEVVVLAALGQRDAMVEPEEKVSLLDAGVVEVDLGGGILDDEVDVVDLTADGVGDLVQGFADEAAEVLAFQG